MLSAASQREAQITAELDVDGLFGRLSAALEAGGLSRDGRLLPERELCSRLGVGRHGLRQALARLEGEGVIWRRQGQGTFLSAVHAPRQQAFLEETVETSPAEMMEVRIEFEPILARLCALRASRDQIQDIRQRAVFAADAATAHGLENADFAFHRSVALGANNVLLLAMFDLATATLRRADWRAARQSTFSQSRRAEVAIEHDSIVTAIAERNPRTAEMAMRDHLRSVYDHLQRQHQ
ncbi:MAG: FadR/GntR family transcriptional regulator [Cypionkella sp.]